MRKAKPVRADPNGPTCRPTWAHSDSNALSCPCREACSHLKKLGRCCFDTDEDFAKRHRAKKSGQHPNPTAMPRIVMPPRPTQSPEAKICCGVQQGGTGCLNLCAKHRKPGFESRWPSERQLWNHHPIQVSDAFGTQLLRSLATLFQERTPNLGSGGPTVVSRF